MERVAAAWREVHGRDVIPADIDSMYADFVPIQRAVLQEHATPIPGVREALAAFRARGLAIGTTTGYSRDLINVVEPHAGLDVDCVITSSDVTDGRPAPWMALAAAAQLGVYPMRACVKIGDTLADIDEGRNAGMWSVGITRTGNELGLSEEEERALPVGERAERLAAASERMLAAGAHATVESVADMLPVLDDIEARLARDERP
jgi:phosphonoacetaldehyde hydrolase